MSLASEKDIIETAREEGQTEGIEIGEKRKALKSARIMAEKGFSLEDIMEVSGLSREEVKEVMDGSGKSEE